ncbi:hypothetical protein LINGRAHAP2_LOCUS23163 [Linum grandiflorum]
MSGRLDAPLHFTTYLLNPFYIYINPAIFDDPDVTAALITCVEQFYHGDEDLHNEVVNIDFTKFQRREGLFGKNITMTGLKFDYNPVAWWKMYGGDAKNLQKMAIRIMSLTSSSSASERNWSTFKTVSLAFSIYNCYIIW